MLRTIAALAALSALTAGCIAVPEDPNAIETADAPQDFERIDGMTAEEAVTDSDVDCDEGGGINVPRFFCSERVVEAQGRIGLDRLPVDLDGVNGAITIATSPDDTWTFTATVRVGALTQEMAREGLDTAWTWTHENGDGTHSIVAGPTPQPDVSALGARVRSTEYELALPAWVVLDLRASTDNGAIAVSERMLDDADLSTRNGQIILSGDVQNVRASTENGQIIAKLRPFASGGIDLATQNGQVILKLAEDRAHGYDIDATSENGQVLIKLDDCESRSREESTSDYPGSSTSASCRTAQYEARDIQTRVTIDTENAQVIVSPI